MINIDCVYIINLSRSIKHLKKKVKPLPFLSFDNSNIKFIEAVNGWDLKDSLTFKTAKWWNINSYNAHYNRDITPGEIGCGLSHFKCLKDAKENQYQNILIFEEDFLVLEPLPTKEIFENLPNDWSLIYLGRNKVWEDFKEKKVNNYLRYIGYSYDTHALILSKKGIDEILTSRYLDNVIAWDEFLAAINGTTSRRDAIEVFHNPKFVSLGFEKNYIDQMSHREDMSNTEMNNLK